MAPGSPGAQDEVGTELGIRSETWVEIPNRLLSLPTAHPQICLPRTRP